MRVSSLFTMTALICTPASMAVKRHQKVGRHWQQLVLLACMLSAGACGVEEHRCGFSWRGCRKSCGGAVAQCQGLRTSGAAGGRLTSHTYCCEPERLAARFAASFSSVAFCVCARQ